MNTTHRAEAHESEREDFERWALSVGWHDRDLIRAHSGDYREWQTQKAYQGWLARAARATPPTEPVAAPFSQQRVAHLVGRLRDSSGGHINGLYDREAADMLEELAQLADSEGSRAVKYLRRARDAEARIAALEAPPTEPATPIDMVLHCPNCGEQHIDEPESPHADADVASGYLVTPDKWWTNPPHRSHLCHGCGHIWRPADVPTNGVAAVKTKGKADSPVSARIAALEAAAVPTSAAVPVEVVQRAQALTDYLWATEMGNIPFHLVSDLRAALATLQAAEPAEERMTHAEWERRYFPNGLPADVRQFDDPWRGDGTDAEPGAKKGTA